MHLTALCTPCIAFMLVAHTCTFAIGHEEQGLEEPPEPAPVMLRMHWNALRDPQIPLDAKTKVRLNMSQCALWSPPGGKGIHYVTRRSDWMQKHKFGVMCPSSHSIESLPVPLENEK
jgi:hypothetical protein